MKGIDISSFQRNNIDFKKVKASGIEIVYIKATEGITFDSPGFRLQYAQAKLEGLKIGFYHYLRANDPVAEAKHFLKSTNGLQVDCKYAIDVEVTLGQNKAKISDNVRKFANYMISQGKEVCIYTGDYFYANSLNSTVKDLSLWVAHYGVIKPNVSTYAGFQYSQTGKVDGISGNVDLNVFNEGIFLKNTSLGAKTASTQTVKPSGNGFIKRLQTELNKQYNSRLDVDGYIGKLTLGACPTMRITAKGNITRLLQEKLGVVIDGVFGTLTFNAVVAFQKKKGLSSDGVVGDKTWEALLK